MNRPSNVVPFLKEPVLPDGGEAPAPGHILGMLHRKDFELWVSRTPSGALSLKWWRWREELERFFPVEDGELTLNASELKPLADLLISVDGILNKGQGRKA